MPTGSGKKPQKRSKEFLLQEYGLVSVEELDERRTEESETGLLEQAKSIWDERFIIAKITTVFIAIRLAIVLLAPKNT